MATYNHLLSSLTNIKTNKQIKNKKMYKIFVCALLAAAGAAPAGEATSYTSFNENHNSIHHIQSAPVHYSAPTQYSPPAQYSAPVVTKIAVTPAAPSYYQAAPSPIVTKVAVPIVTKQVIAAPVAKPAPAYHEAEYPAGPAKYEFIYTVADPQTGDFHSQEEKRDGDHVVGQYSLHEADGTVRIVKYFDEGHGFNAVIEKQGHSAEAPVAYKKIVAAAVPQYPVYH